MTDKTQPVWRERLSSPLTWHIAGAAVLLIVVVVLGIMFALDWSATSTTTMDAMQTKQVQLKVLEKQTAPLRGLDKRVEITRRQIKTFYDTRVPANYSQILTRIGDLEVKSGVRLMRVEYVQRPPGAHLTEIVMDAGISGQYPQIMHFINSLERDKTLFIIRGMGLTGQQGGLVNLRLQVSTWLRPADAAASGLPTQAEDKAARKEDQQQ